MSVYSFTRKSILKNPNDYYNHENRLNNCVQGKMYRIMPFTVTRFPL